MIIFNRSDLERMAFLTKSAGVETLLFGQATAVQTLIAAIFSVRAFILEPAAVAVARLVRPVRFAVLLVHEPIDQQLAPREDVSLSLCILSSFDDSVGTFLVFR
ncbi:hypothetical protein [Yoonia sp. SS1-5]|uniref:Uncharacterized protein n=1 Tax=Yoonia rhodophyticola TaxID=3137370 RepID=A0AAN0M619_9RHOB